MSPVRRHRRRLQRPVGREGRLLIAGYYPGIAEAAKEGLKDKVVALNQALLSQEMFVAFSKKSPCRSLAGNSGKASPS